VKASVRKVYLLELEEDDLAVIIRELRDSDGHRQATLTREIVESTGYDPSVPQIKSAEAAPQSVPSPEFNLLSSSSRQHAPG
jgi:hypothetical protein